MEHIEYPDCDGRPIGEDTLHFDWIVRIEQNLEGLFRKDSNKPDTGHLEGWRRAAGSSREVPEMAGFVSPRLGIRFEPREGPDNLRIIGPDGRPFLTYAEAYSEYKAAEKRVEEAMGQLRKADNELAGRRQSADEPHRLVERYAAKLRELGIEPD